MELREQAEKIQTRDDLALFIQHLIRDFRTCPERWENTSLEAYLEAVAAWINDMDGYYRHRGETIPRHLTRRHVGEILLAAEAKQHDPFALYTVCGSLFPEGDGDEYLSLCLKAQPDHATAMRQIFAQDPNPSFAVIDAVDGGLGWPNLRALLGMESGRDILFTLLAPSEAQLTVLKGQESWVVEAREAVRGHARAHLEDPRQGVVCNRG
jgi:hypothetical protein